MGAGIQSARALPTLVPPGRYLPAGRLDKPALCTIHPSPLSPIRIPRQVRALQSRLRDEAVRLERPPDDVPHVVAPVELPQEALELKQLLVVGAVEPRLYRHAVVDLVAEGVGGVVHEDRAGEVPAEDREVLEEVPLCVWGAGC